MRFLFILGCCLVIFSGCKKERGNRVDIYLLKSFTTTTNTSTSPATMSISNAVLEETPLIKDEDILFYTKSTYTFSLKNNFPSTLYNFGADKGFAVAVDGEPVYFGKFQPGYLSYIPFGHALITPILPQELNITFPMISGSTDLVAMDKRNDELLLNTLKATGRLR